MCGRQVETAAQRAALGLVCFLRLDEFDSYFPSLTETSGLKKDLDSHPVARHRHCIIVSAIKFPRL